MSVFPELNDDAEEGMLFYPDLAPAYLGSAYRCGLEGPVAVYDYHLLVQLLIERDGMTEEDAIEYVDFNILGAYIGERTPLILVMTPLDEDASIDRDEEAGDDGA
jgi:hypothetical protein